MMAYEESESAWDNFGKFIHQLQLKTKTLIRKLERILNKLYRQNLSLLFNEYTHTHKYLELRQKQAHFRKPVQSIFGLWPALQMVSLKSKYPLASSLFNTGLLNHNFKLIFFYFHKSTTVQIFLIACCHIHTKLGEDKFKKQNSLLADHCDYIDILLLITNNPSSAALYIFKPSIKINH